MPLEDVDAPAGYAVDESVHTSAESVDAGDEGDVCAEATAFEVAALSAETEAHDGEAPPAVVDGVAVSLHLGIQLKPLELHLRHWADTADGETPSPRRLLWADLRKCNCRSPASHCCRLVCTVRALLHSLPLATRRSVGRARSASSLTTTGCQIPRSAVAFELMGVWWHI